MRFTYPIIFGGAKQITLLVKDWEAITHVGQGHMAPASPTRLGKESKFFARLESNLIY